MCLGVMFGSAEVSTVAFAEELGAKSRSGLLLALWAFGSLSAGLVTGAIHWRRGPATRVAAGSAGLLVVMTPLTFIDSLTTMGVMLLVAGFAIAPTLIASMALTEQTAPPGRLTESMAIIHTGLVAGVAPGAAIAGVVIDREGASAAYLVAAVAAGLATLASLALPRRPVTPTQDRSAPEPASLAAER
jgi:predicted MFS family arabinose efflux permease